MSTNERSATAYARLSALNARRETWHTVRYQCVKQRRSLRELTIELGNAGRLDESIQRVINELDYMCVEERERCWAEITKLDNEIDTLTHQINEGVYDAS